MGVSEGVPVNEKEKELGWPKRDASKIFAKF